MAQIKMNMNSTNAQLQQSSSQLMEEEEPSYAIFFSELEKQVSQEQAQDIASRVIPQLLKTQGENFMEGLRVIQKLMIKGYGNILANEELFTKKLMKQFCKFSYLLEKDPKSEIRMIFVLSIIAQIIKQVPNFKFPFRIKFLKNLFLIDRQLLEQSPYKNNILAILAVIYENLASQPRLLKTFKLSEKVKLLILENYSLNEEIFSISLFNKAIKNLLKGDQHFTAAQISKYRLVQTVNKFISKTEKKLGKNSFQMPMKNKKFTKQIIPTIIIPPKTKITAQ